MFPLHLNHIIVNHEIRLPHCRLRPFRSYLCLLCEADGQTLPGDRQALAFGRQRLLRANRRHQRTQVWGTYLPHLRQRCVGLREQHRAVQPLYELTGRQLQRQAV